MKNPKIKKRISEISQSLLNSTLFLIIFYLESSPAFELSRRNAFQKDQSLPPLKGAIRPSMCRHYASSIIDFSVINTAADPSLELEYKLQASTKNYILKIDASGKQGAAGSKGVDGSQGSDETSSKSRCRPYTILIIILYYYHSLSFFGFLSYRICESTSEPNYFK